MRRQLPQRIVSFAMQFLHRPLAKSAIHIASMLMLSPEYSNTALNIVQVHYTMQTCEGAQGPQAYRRSGDKHDQAAEPPGVSGAVSLMCCACLLCLQQLEGSCQNWFGCSGATASLS